ncbi:hypothetical protein Cri9333_0600 [Crinalium epipsammum PCC 9333]|uniref:Uncharacterized protein n=1 Tax=Crinalium epipsammum PCC 9333 TaxID=1173022 RepID=K9VWN7_9CYAN|nr:hypothetical protein Cri9333_0600 [Crinalium epipsammum PCC 9333]
MKKFLLFCLRSPCSIILWEFCSLFFWLSTANAGGFGEQKPPSPQPISVPSPEVITPSPAPVIPPSPTPTTTDKTSGLNVVTPILNWDKWGQTYWSNQNICREMNANVICLSAQTARQMRWQIPPKNQAINSVVRARKL